MNLQEAKAAVNPNSIPEILYAGDLLTISANNETKLESKREPLRISLITADNQEFILESFINKSKRKAQCRLPLLPDSSGNMFRVVIKISGESISASSPLGFTRLLLEQPQNNDFNLDGEKPLNLQVELSTAFTIPEGTDTGIYPELAAGPQGPKGDQGEKGEKGEAGEPGPTIVSAADIIGTVAVSEKANEALIVTNPIQENIQSLQNLTNIGKSDQILVVNSDITASKDLSVAEDLNVAGDMSVAGNLSFSGAYC